MGFMEEFKQLSRLFFVRKENLNCVKFVLNFDKSAMGTALFIL